MDPIVGIITLVIWFSIGLILANWVKKDMEKRNLKGIYMFILILFTSFIGFAFYVIVTHGETGVSEGNYDFSEFDEIIDDEEEEEFYDEIEEISEEVVEDIIENVLENKKVEKINMIH